jgi:hypothetical protein
MLLELVIANLLFLGLVTTIMGWQCDVIVSFVRLKERVECLRGVADRHIRNDSHDTMEKYRIEEQQQPLYLSSQGQQHLVDVLGGVPDYRWFYTCSVVSMKRAGGRQHLMRLA